MSDLNVTVNSPITRVVSVGTSLSQGVAISSLESRLVNTGSYLESLITVSNAGVSTLNLRSGSLLITGLGGTEVISSGQTIWISGGSSINTGSFVTTGQTGHNHDTQYYPLVSNPSGYIRSVETGQFASDADTLIIANWTGTTPSLYYPLNLNPNSYATTSYVTGASGVLNDRLVSTGSYLFGLINASSAGVSSLNSTSGALSLVGDGNVTVTTNGQTITISGNTGIYSTFITTGQTGVFATSTNLALTGFNIATWTGTTTGLYYPRFINPSGYITGINTGNFITVNQTGNFVTNNQTGNFVTVNQTGAFSSISISGSTILSYANFTGTSGILLVTGVSGLVKVDGGNLQSQINNITGWTGTADTIYVKKIESGQFASVANLSLTGATLAVWTGSSTGLYYPLNTNPSSYITSNQTGGFSTLAVTGSPNLKYVNLTGTSGIFISTGSSGLVTIDGGNLQTQITTINTNLFNTGASLDARIISLSGYSNNTFATITNLVSTGNTIGAWTGSSTGIYYPLTGNPSGFIMSSQSGQFASTANLALTGSVLSSWTGTTTELFYPLASNPSGYVTNSQTGIFATVTNLASTGTTLSNWTGTTNEIYYPKTGWISKSITLENPVSGDSITLFYTNTPILIKKVSYILQGSNSSGRFSIFFDPNRSLNGTELKISGFSVTGITTGTHFNSFDNPTISGNSFVWFKVQETGTSLSGVHQTIFYTVL
jgi:hypothetical protein